MLRLVLAILLTQFASIAWANCTGATFTEPANVRGRFDEVLIVVHASSIYDPRHATKHGIDAAVRLAKSQRIPVIYLADDHPLSTYFMDDCRPDYWVYSQGGEVRFNLEARHILLAGGHLESCLSAAVHDLMFQASSRPATDLRFTYFLDAIYSNVKSIDSNAPYVRDVERFMGVVTYGRPHGEAWPKATMLELLGVIQRPSDIQAFLGSVLPQWSRTFPDRLAVRTRYGGEPARALRKGNSLFAPVLEFRFLDSAEGNH